MAILGRVLRRNWSVALALLLSLSLLCLVLPFPALAGGVPASLRSDTGEVTRGLPIEVSAASALVVDANTGQIILSKEPHVRRAPASTTKIMTAIIVLETAELSDEVKIAPQDLVGGSSMGLATGDVVRVDDLLYGLLLNSGNDAAQALARHVGDLASGGEGEIAAFVDLMNEKAEKLGLQDTRFTNPSGGDDSDHYSSALDLAELTRYALRNPTFSKIVATGDYTAQGRRLTYSLSNQNELLGTYPGVDGVKIGTTGAAGQCLVTSLSEDGHRIIIVVLGSVDRYADTRAIIDHVRATREWVKLAPPSSEIPQLQGRSGEWRVLLARGPVQLAFPSWQVSQLVRVVEVSRSPVAGTRQPVGWVRYYLQHRQVAAVPLYLAPQAHKLRR